MKTKFFTVFAALALSAGQLCAVTVEIDGINYNLNETDLTAEVANTYNSKDTLIIIIPASVEYKSKTYSVTSIGSSAFSYCSGLTSVTIPNSVTRIGDRAFEYCNLKSVTIPASVTSIGDYAFSGCSGLTSVTIPASVMSIGKFAFANTAWYNNLPDGPVYIGKSFYAYKGTMPANTSFTIDAGTLQICGSAFYNCSGLTSVTIPNSVTSIGSGAFSGCRGLTSVTIPNSVTRIGEKAFYNCRGLTSVTIPNSVTSIGDRAFEDCRGLTSVTIPNSVTSIGDYAFSGCTGLTSVTIPNSVTNIGRHAFANTAWYNNLPDGPVYIKKFFYAYKGTMPANTSFTIASGTLQICGGAFYKCSGLTSVTIPNSVTNIGSYAFYNCTGLTSVTIPNSVTNIGSYAFYNCTGLTSVTIPNFVTSIGNQAFYGCTGLTSVTIPASVTSIGYQAFYWGTTDILRVDYTGNLTDWCDIEFGYWPFYNYHLYINHEKVTDLVIPAGVLNIRNYVFSGCSGLTSITIPTFVTRIGDGAFSDCSGLTSVTIPNSVTRIGSNAFYNCSGLTSVTIPNSITSIGSYAFYNCTGLTSVTIPNSVTSIGKKAFYGCTGLTSVTIPASVTSIENSTFSGCSGLTSVTIPNSVTSIGSHAFYNTGLTSVIIPNSVTSIGAYAFYGCTGLTFVTCYAETPPTTDYHLPLFSRQDTLRVPYKSIEAYRADRLWGNFKVIQGIGATLIDNVEEVTVKADTTTALFCWPALATVTHYVLEVYTNSSNMRSFTFGVSGEMITAKMSWTEIEEMAAQHLGYTYTVTGLTPETRYYYRLESKDDSDRVWDSKSGTFTTKSSMGLTIKTDPLVGVFARAGKIVVEGYAQCDVSVYDLTGRLVTQRTNVTNCTLEVPKGTYIVRKGKEVGKVMVP